jgi:type II restriction/modification system DNA methylase subunit YeeA
LVAICKDDDIIFGILESHTHHTWTRAKVALHGVVDSPTYNNQEIFETFPFPAGLEPNRKPADYDNPYASAIADAAKRLNDLRENWLNPPDLVKRVPEVVPGYPDRIEPVGVAARAELKKRTLTNLYNARPAWLANAHADLDAAVAAAYGWPTDLSDDEILKRLLDLNLARSTGG